MSRQSLMTRRDFLKRVATGALACGALSLGGCERLQPSEIVVVPSATVTATDTPTPLPTATATVTSTATATNIPTLTPTATATFAPGDLSHLVTPEMAEFLVQHEILRGDTTRKVAMLTYDDEPYNDDDLNFLLDALQKQNAKATFFFVGRALRYRKTVIQRLVEEGHLLACHGYLHDVPLTQLSSARIEEQFDNFFEDVAEILPGYRVRFFRAPFGSVDERVRKIAAQWGLQHVLWTDISNGWFENAYKIVEQVSEGAIILCHMFRYFDLHEAEKMVMGLRERNFSVETVATGISPADLWPVG
jgi:peptidoglycan/xylan/chitin deacetylase (PgdA/CDA1 family)